MESERERAENVRAKFCQTFYCSNKQKKLKAVDDIDHIILGVDVVGLLLP